MVQWVTVVPFVALAVLTGGCISPAAQRERDVAAYGVRVIRPGMTEAEVGAILGPSRPNPVHGVTTGMFSEMSTMRGESYPHADLSVTFLGVPSKVDCCRPLSITSTVPGGITFSDTELRALLAVGLEPAEVTRRIGPPAAAFENEPGTVHTVHQRPGIWVTYEDGMLKGWRRHHVYTAKDIPSAMPSP